MSWRHALGERIRRNEPLPPLVGPVLTAVTPIFRIGMWARMRAPRTKLDAHVISYGNITAGGTGKTPAVIERVQRELAAGKRVAVLTRGYGGSAAGQPLVVKPEGDATGLYAALGDEPALIAMKAPGVVIAKGADRVRAGREAIEKFECDTLILDDGYQYIKLERDENILVVDATNPFGNKRLLPRGILREPIEAVKRATKIILTRCDLIKDLRPLEQRLQQLNPDVPIRRTIHKPTQFRRIADSTIVPLDEFRGKQAIAACGIGNPDAFRATLELLEIEVTTLHSVTDHHALNPATLHGKQPIVITEKDAIRIENPSKNVFALEIALCGY
jgi:tetraacyldisaccharide 4'-kinase